MTLLRLSIHSALVRLVAGLILFAAAVGSASAHHGWAWADDGNSELTGVIQSAKLGNPHGILTLVVDGAQWTVEVGQPWRNERAGLHDSMLVKGVTLTVVGHKSANPKQRVFKAERVFINGKKFDLYPDRD